MTRSHFHIVTGQANIYCFTRYTALRKCWSLYKVLTNIIKVLQSSFCTYDMKACEEKKLCLLFLIHLRRDLWNNSAWLFFTGVEEQ